MNKPHKHADLIKAWADGAEIEYFNSGYSKWVLCALPNWGGIGDYRIKPEPKPDVVNTLCLDYSRGGVDDMAIIELTFDGETGKLKAAEVIA